MPNQKTILIVAANPSNETRLRLDVEARDIDEGLRLAKHRDQFVLKQQQATRARDLPRAMQEHEPTIVHFCGHGSGEQGIVLENNEGKTQLVSTEALANFFELFADKVECVVLNACFSQMQAKEIVKHIPYVIGMTKSIGDKAAIEFAVGFYGALAAGSSYEKAYKFGQSAIEMAGISGHDIPQLLKKSINIITSTEPVVTRQAAIFNVPIPRNPFFTGRGDILAKLHEALQSKNAIAIKPSEKATALSGLGGVGKTQTVAEYAHRYKCEYSAVLWVLSDGTDLLRSSFAQLSVLLGFKAEKQDDQILAVQSWLRNNSGWLLIFDNAETLEILTAAKELLPIDAPGHVLFTTRAQATGNLTAVTVDCFDEETGAVFLVRRSKLVDKDLATVEQVRPNLSDDNWQTAITLVHELGGLALAMDQAGAYIEQTDCGLDGYLLRFRNNAPAMLKERQYVHSTDHPEAVYRTFLLAAENAKSRSELAYEILLDSALLHPDGISEKLYTDCDPLDLDKALATLKDYSLIQRVPERQLFTVHRLVQVVIRDVCDG